MDTFPGFKTGIAMRQPMYFQEDNNRILGLLRQSTENWRDDRNDQEKKKSRIKGLQVDFSSAECAGFQSQDAQMCM